MASSAGEIGRSAMTRPADFGRLPLVLLALVLDTLAVLSVFRVSALRARSRPVSASGDFFGRTGIARDQHDGSRQLHSRVPGVHTRRLGKFHCTRSGLIKPLMVCCRLVWFQALKPKQTQARSGLSQ